jgi:hypothetical protein
MLKKRCRILPAGGLGLSPIFKKSPKLGGLGGCLRPFKQSRLGYFEQYHAPENAIVREKRLKKYNRRWKLEFYRKRESGMEGFIY